MALKKISEFATAYESGRQLVVESTLLFALEAVRFYAAYGTIQSLDDVYAPKIESAGDPVDMDVDFTQPRPVRDASVITGDTELTLGEWAIISPLYELYVERECAVLLEASRANGLEVYGRSVSEIVQDINLLHSPDGIPARAMRYGIITI